jgi:hypothetical protein
MVSLHQFNDYLMCMSYCERRKKHKENLTESIRKRLLEKKIVENMMITLKHTQVKCY